MLQLQTHYVKTKPKNDPPFRSALHSLMYRILRVDKLHTAESAVEDFYKYLRVHPEDNDDLGRSSYRDIVGSLTCLSEQGFLKEVHGTKLSRLIERL
jgi:hypothetical protein